MLIRFLGKEYETDKMKDWEKGVLKLKVKLEIRKCDEEYYRSIQVGDSGLLQITMMKQAKLDSILKLL